LAKNEEFAFSDLELEGRSRCNITKKKDLQKESVRNQNEMIYNAYGVPVGKKRNDLRSYVGMIVQERILIIYDDWRKVPLDLKDMLWTHFQEMFKLSPKFKTQVFRWMGSSLRNFKSKLANEYTLTNADKLNSLKLPPIEFEGIKKED
ncbi:hypothetical protein CISIN_1g040564mg, partial [Citrus sinensis]